MDFHFINSSQSQLPTSREPYSEFQDFDEEDVLYAELRRQVLVLTADDTDDFTETKRSKSLCRTTACRPPKLQPEAESYFRCWEMQNNESVPAWLVNLWREGTGTGVFIPQIVKTRRRWGHGTICNGRRRIQAGGAEKPWNGIL